MPDQNLEIMAVRFQTLSVVAQTLYEAITTAQPFCEDIPPLREKLSQAQKLYENHIERDRRLIGEH